MLFCARKNEFRNTSRPVQQYRGYLQGWVKAILESPKSHAGGKHAGHRSLPGNSGPDIREFPIAIRSLRDANIVLLRSSAPLPSSLSSGAGSRNGSTPSLHPKYSSSPNRMSYQLSPPLLRSKTYRKSTEESWTMNLESCRIWTPKSDNT